MNWAVGQNMPGYLPESDVYITSEYEDARAALVEELETAREFTASTSLYGGIVEFDREVDFAINELSTLPSGAEYSVTIDNIAYWLHQTDEEVSEDA